MSASGPVAADSPSRSKGKLLAFFAVVVVIFVGTVVTGLLQRDHMRELGGNLLVSVWNESPTRYRTDLIVDGMFTTLELEGGEKGLVRYSPAHPTTIELRQFRKNVLIGTVTSELFQPRQKAQLKFVLKGNNDIKIISEGPGGGT